MRMRLFVLMLVALATGTVLAQTAVYKWVDKSGNVHYSSVPPSASLAPTSIVNTANSPAEPATTAPPASTLSAANQALTTAEPGDSAGCTSAREALSKYLGAAYLYTLDKSGAKQKLSQQQQDEAIAQAKSAVTQNCSPQEP